MEELEWKILSLTARRGLVGVTREDLFREIRGLRYEDLENAARHLEADGYVQIEWTGPSKFVVAITEKGSKLAADEYEQRLKAYEERIQSQRRAVGGLDKV
ncbi:MAG: hypothetical protein HY557_02450 [Euryarchaeota archaeon]|nr:hypothetical protein [Euryarchaeota archaeon]